MHRFVLLVAVAPVVVAAAAAPAAPAAAQVPVATEFDRLHFRSIGPATMSGRIADVAVVEANPFTYYVATAHGGLWKTTSNGALWTPLLQDQGLLSLGDVTVSQRNPALVWVGGGEANNRQSTGWGDGVYKSTDGGATFTHMGLRASKHINRIVIDPTNDDVVFVAATGPLWGPGGDRGVYKTTDGGRSWRKVLGGDEDTGANDIALDPRDPRILYASLYQRRRSACCMNGGGPGSGLFKSTDGGETWSRVAGGFPQGPLGRIAVDVARSNPAVLYALVEAPARSAAAAAAAATEGGPGMAPAPQQGPGGDTGLWRSDDAGLTWRRVSPVNPRPMYFSQVRVDPTDPERVYLGGVGLHLSVDGGKSFATDAALATHDDIHAIWINPANPAHVIIGNDGGIAVSYDRSATWTFVPNLPVGLFYHVSYDLSVPFNVCGGMQDNYNWCGPSRSRHAGGIYNYDWFQILGGDGFHALPDHRDARIVYTESQNGNMIRRNTVTGESRSIRPSPLNVTPAPAPGETYRWNWDTPMVRSPHDAGVLYVAANKVFRTTDRGDSWTVISPDLTTGADRDTIRTMGVAGRDITIARHDGISQWPTISALAESPRQPGLLYAGTDDGRVHLTRDGGATWTDLTPRLPGFPVQGYVARVVPSAHAPGRAYVAVDNHRLNDYAAYIWVTDDFGATWRRIDATLAGETVHTLTEDLRNPDVLYAGTESGLFLTLDRGATWRRLKANLPHVRVDEITIHHRDNALLVATHGRALFVLDDLTPIQEYTAVARAGRPALFTPGMALLWRAKDDRNDEFWGHQTFIGENPPFAAVVAYHTPTAPKSVALRVLQGSRTIRTVAVPAARLGAGIGFACWDFRAEPVPGPTGGPGGGGGGGFGQQGPSPVPGIPVPLPSPGYLPDNPCQAPGQGGGGGPGGGGGFGFGAVNAGPFLPPGTYTVALVVDSVEVDRKPLRVQMDPAVTFAPAERAAYDRIVNELHDAHARGAAMATRLTALQRSVTAAAPTVDSAATPAVKAQWAAFRRDLDSLRARFGVAAVGPGGPGGGGGGGGFGGAALQPANAVGRVAAIKTALIGVWEPVSPASRAQAAAAQAALTAALRDAEALLERVPAMNAALQPTGVTIARP